MKYCPYCGSYNSNPNGNFCELCGAPLNNYKNVNFDNPYVNNNSNNNVNVNNGTYPIQEGNTAGWGILGFFIPLAGLRLFVIWNKERPKSAKSAGIGALVRVILSVVLFIVFFTFLVITEPNYEERERINYPYETWERRYEEDWT